MPGSPSLVGRRAESWKHKKRQSAAKAWNPVASGLWNKIQTACDRIGLVGSNPTPGAYFS